MSQPLDRYLLITNVNAVVVGNLFLPAHALLVTDYEDYGASGVPSPRDREPGYVAPRRYELSGYATALDVPLFRMPIPKYEPEWHRREGRVVGAAWGKEHVDFGRDDWNKPLDVRRLSMPEEQRFEATGILRHAMMLLVARYWHGVNMMTPKWRSIQAVRSFCEEHATPFLSKLEAVTELPIRAPTAPQEG